MTPTRTPARRSKARKARAPDGGVLCWHVAPEDARLRYDDRRPIVAGETLHAAGERKPELCEWGMHGSVRLMDALVYAQGATVCRVTIGGDVQHDDDKLVGRWRRCEWMIPHADGERILRAHARGCALAGLHLWDAPGVVRKFLVEGDDSLRAAAWTAARTAGWYAARAAAWTAARDAAWDAAGTAATDAARDAAWTAAWTAARDAAWDALNAKLESMCEIYHRDGYVPLALDQAEWRALVEGATKPAPPRGKRARGGKR